MEKQWYWPPGNVCPIIGPFDWIGRSDQIGGSDE